LKVENDPERKQTMKFNLVSALDAAQLALLPEELKASDVDAQLRAENHSNFITVTKGQQWFAVMMWWNSIEDFLKPGEGFWEPYETEAYRWDTQEQAIQSGKDWAEAEGLRFIEPEGGNYEHD